MPPASHLPLRLSWAAPGYASLGDQPGPPSTDAGVTPLIGAPPPRGPHQSFTVFCKHLKKPRWTRELACIVLGPTVSQKDPLPAALTLAHGSVALGLYVCFRPPWPSGARWSCLPPPESLGSSSVTHWVFYLKCQPLSGAAPWPVWIFEVLQALEEILAQDPWCDLCTGLLVGIGW